MGLGESKSQVKVSDAKDQKEQLLRALLLLSLTHDQKWQAPEALLPFRGFFFFFLYYFFLWEAWASKQAASRRCCTKLERNDTHFLLLFLLSGL